MSEKRHYGLGHIYQRNSVWWIQYRIRSKRYRESSGSTKRSDARKLLEKRLGEHNVGKFAPEAERVTFENMVDLIRDDYTNKARKSWNRTERSVNHLREVFGADLAIHITDRRIDAYAATRLREGASRSTVSTEMAALKRMFKLAIEKRMLAQQPAFPKFGDLKNAREEFLEDWEYAALHHELPNHLKEVLTFIFFTGWRFNSEVRTLKWEQVDFDRGTVSLHLFDTKNDEGRRFPYTGIPRLQEAIERQRSYTDDVEQRTGKIVPWVFHKEGRQVDAHRNGFYKAWREACMRAGVQGRDGKHKIPHDCRRSGVRRLEWSGVPREVAKQLVGHKTDSMYERYNIVREDDLRAGVEMVQEYEARKAQKSEEKTPEPSNVV